MRPLQMFLFKTNLKKGTVESLLHKPRLKRKNYGVK